MALASSPGGTPSNLRLEGAGTIGIKSGKTLNVGELGAPAGNTVTVAGPGTLALTGQNIGSGVTTAIGSLKLRKQAKVVNKAPAAWDSGAGKIDLGGASDDVRFTNGATGTLAITGTGTGRGIQGFGTFANAGVLNVVTSTATQTVNVGSPFTNTGTLNAGRGTFDPVQPTNLAGGVLTGGTWNAATGVITLPSAVTTNAATVVLGAQGQIPVRSTTTPAFASMTTNTGSFTTGRALDLTGALTNSGALTVSGNRITMSVPSYTQTAGTTTVAALSTLGKTGIPVAIDGGVLTGSGTVIGAVTGNGGTITPGTAGVGTLSVTGTVTSTTSAPLTVKITETASDGTKLAISGALAGAGLTVNVTTPSAPPVGTVRTILTHASVASGARLTGAAVPAANAHWEGGGSSTATTLTLVAN